MQPTPEQAEAVTKFGTGEATKINAYAGTGKTSVVGALIHALDRAKRKVVVLAPTGRAAKVASSRYGADALLLVTAAGQIFAAVRQQMVVLAAQ